MSDGLGTDGGLCAGFDPNRMTIDLGIVAANFGEVRRRLGPRRKIIGTLKGDAYGHGAVPVARILVGLGVDLLASGNLREAIALRRAGIAAPVVLLGAQLAAAIPDIVANDLIPTLDDPRAAAALSRAARSPLPVFVKVDGGFGRFGVPLAEAAAFVAAGAARPMLTVAGLYTHLPFADAPGRDWARGRTAAFDALASALAARGLAIPVVQSLASPGLLAGLKDGGTAVAVGHLLYGLSPVGDELGRATAVDRFRPVLRAIKARLIHVGERPPGEAAAPYLRHCRGSIGVVSIGIQHGYRPALGAAHMLIGGRPAPLLRVCLENTIVDLAGHPDAAIGDAVVVVGARQGPGVSLRDLAAWQSTSPLGLLTALGRSLPRRYVEM